MDKYDRDTVIMVLLLFGLAGIISAFLIFSYPVNTNVNSTVINNSVNVNVNVNSTNKTHFQEVNEFILGDYLNDTN